MTFGNRLSQLREERGFHTRKSFAEKIGIPETTLRNYETDVREPGHTFLKQMSDFFKVSTDYLLGITEEKERRSTHQLKSSEFEHIEKYRSLDPHGQQTVDYILDRELERTTQAKESADTIAHLQQQLAIRSIPPHFFAYYGKIAAAGTSVEFSDIAAGVRAYPENEINKNADYVIGVNGDSMDPEYSDGDIVYVQKTDHIETGDIGIFQKGNNIYIKKAGENGLISLNPNYPPLTADGDRIIVLGKVLGKAEEN
jgi:phage repressor protein C with HTH and peptisase S24 domain